MAKERDANYYDQQWTSAKWRKDWNQISKVRTKLYKKASSLVPQQAPLVVDLGCGGGHFAQCLDQLNKPMAYAGFDFSEAAIYFAKKKVAPSETWSYHQADLTKLVISQTLPPGAVYVCLEVLEHIQDDLRIFSLIPEGAQVIISVPSFDEPSHVRHFKSFAHVIDRYRNKVDFQTVRQSFSIWKWHLFSGTRHETIPKEAPASGNLFPES